MQGGLSCMMPLAKTWKVFFYVCIKLSLIRIGRFIETLKGAHSSYVYTNGRYQGLGVPLMVANLTVDHLAPPLHCSHVNSNQ